VDAGGQHGTSIRRIYTGQLILSSEQFQGLVDIYLPFRGLIETVLEGYSEDENGSWRDFCGYAFDGIPEELHDRAEKYVNSLRDQVPKTPGLGGGTEPVKALPEPPPGVVPPTLGVVPKWLRQEQRLEELCAAVVRYRQASIRIPDEWLGEMRDLAGELLSRQKEAQETKGESA
jgi:hypothetical protein